MASKRFLMVPVDSSAASTPLPGATRARATLLRSARFIGASSRALAFGGSNVLASQNRRFSGNSQENGRDREGRRRARGGSPSCEFRVELALDVALRHLGWRQHLLDLAGLPRGIELLQSLLAKL